MACRHVDPLQDNPPRDASCPYCQEDGAWHVGGRLVPGGPTFQSTFKDIFAESFDLLVERQRKYGPTNIQKLGLFGVFGRLSDDKIERIRRGLNGKIEHGVVTIEGFEDFGDESFEDALFDIANYALIMIALKRGVWGRPLA